jgi:flagellar protein FliS
MSSSLPTTTSAQAAARYRTTQIQASSPLERVVLLYDGAIRFIDAARAAIERKDIGARRIALGRAIAIVGELTSTLDMERGGEVAKSLDALYAFVSRRLLDAARQQQVAPLDDCRRILDTLREGWREAAAESQKIPA